MRSSGIHSNGAEPMRKKLNSALIQAARWQRVNQVEHALEMGADANARDGFGLTAMHLAATGGNVRMIQVLMRYGAEPFSADAAGIPPFFSAAISGRIDAMRLLGTWHLDLQAGECVNRSVLEMALQATKMDVAKWLIDHGASFEDVDTQDGTMLSRMTQLKSEEAVELMVDSGARIDRHTLTLLHLLSPTLANKVYLAFRRQQAQNIDAPSEADHAGKSLMHQRPDMITQSNDLDEVEIHTTSLRWSDIVRAASHIGVKACRIVMRPLKAIGDLPQLPQRRQLKARTLALQEAMRRLDPLAAIAIAKLSPIDVESVDENGMNVFQLWCLMTVNMLQPASGETFNGTISTEQELCKDLLLTLAEQIAQHRHVVYSRFDATGNTVLHELIARGHAHMVMHLLKCDVIRALLNTSNDELNRPVHLAAKAGDHRLAMKLVSAGANLNAFNRAGLTPLHMSTISLDQTFAEAAISLGANIRLKTRGGKSLDDILDEHQEKGNALRALLMARRTIDSVKSIFSAGHPLAGAIRAKTADKMGRLARGASDA